MVDQLEPRFTRLARLALPALAQPAPRAAQARSAAPVRLASLELAERLRVVSLARATVALNPEQQENPPLARRTVVRVAPRARSTSRVRQGSHRADHPEGKAAHRLVQAEQHRITFRAALETEHQGRHFGNRIGTGRVLQRLSTSQASLSTVKFRRRAEYSARRFGLSMTDASGYAETLRSVNYILRMALCTNRLTARMHGADEGIAIATNQTLALAAPQFHIERTDNENACSIVFA